MAAQVCNRVRAETPHVDVLAQNVFHAPGFALPVFIFPWPADGGHVLQPGNVLGEFLQFFLVSELPRTAGAIQQEQLVFASKAALFPVPIKSANITDEGSDAG